MDHSTCIPAARLIGKMLDSHENTICPNACWQWPTGDGHGDVQFIKLRKGLGVSIGNLFLREEITVSFADIRYPLIFSYGVTGTLRYDVTLDDGSVYNFNTKPGSSYVCHLPFYSGTSVLPMGVPLNWVSIFMDPLLLSPLLDSSDTHVPVSVYDLANGSKETQFLQMTSRTQATELALRQMLDCPYQGGIKRFYLESKVLELITHSLSQLSASPARGKKPFVLRPQDIERVKYAGEIVRNRLHEPPTLLDLAKLVGLHHSKLNFGFREMFGTTFFNYLRQSRLIKAKALLDEGRMNVTETAYAVGYSSLSHFAKAFKNHFGIAPSAYMREVSSKW